jgi:hypothetical protein
MSFEKFSSAGDNEYLRIKSKMSNNDEMKIN